MITAQEAVDDLYRIAVTEESEDTLVEQVGARNPEAVRDTREPR